MLVSLQYLSFLDLLLLFFFSSPLSEESVLKLGTAGSEHVSLLSFISLLSTPHGVQLFLMCSKSPTVLVKNWLHSWSALAALTVRCPTNLPLVVLLVFDAELLMAG